MPHILKPCSTGWDVKVVIPSTQKSWIGAQQGHLNPRAVVDFDSVRQGIPDRGHREGPILLSQGHRCVDPGDPLSCGFQNPDPDGQGETSPSPRSLREGELGEWILLDAVSSLCSKNLGSNLTQFCLQTPASCANIALHNIFPGEIDLVVSLSRPVPDPFTNFSLFAMLRFPGRIMGGTHLVRTTRVVTGPYARRY